jgi:signal transduction histidine kinase
MTRLRARIEPSTMALSAIVLGTIVVGILAYAVIANIRTDARLANNTRLDLQTMLVLVVDEETGVRGYAATGSKLFLQPYREANQRFPSTFATLERSAQNPNLTSIQDDLEGLRSSHSLWEADVATPIAKGTSSADSDRRLKDGKVLMDRVRAHIGEARDEVEAVANRLSLEVQQAIIVSILAIVLMTIALGIVAVRFEHARLREEQRLREQVDERNAALERSNQSLREFAYVASHDLQEPLRTIASFTELLQKRYAGRLDADADEFIGFVVDGAKRMQQLIDDVLEYSRVSTHGKPLVPVDLDAVARRSVANLRASIEERGAEVTVGPLPRVMGDEIQLGQLLQNLVGNALKYNRSARPRVEVSARRDGRGWRVAVSDNGIGIAPEYHERIFRIFSRLHTRGEYGGTGIGLAICKRIVDRHGGRMMVESEEGKGASFAFSLAGIEETTWQSPAK